MKKEILYTSKTGFLDLAKMYKVAYIFQSPVAIVGVSDSAYIMMAIRPLMKAAIASVISALKSDDGYHNISIDVTSGDVSIQTGSKVELVKVLNALGIDPELMSRIKTVKASELKELLDKSPVSEHDTEVEDISIRLTRTSDKVEFSTGNKALKKVRVKYRGKGGGFAYSIDGNMKEYVATVLTEVFAEYNVPVYPGFPVRAEMNYHQMENMFEE